MGHNGCDGPQASGPWAIGSGYRFTTTEKKIYKKARKLQLKIWPRILWMKMKNCHLWRMTVHYGCPKGTSLSLDLLYLHLRP